MFTIHSLLVFFIILCIVGLICWGISTIPGLPPVVKTVVYVIIGVALLLWLLNMIGGTGLSLR